MKNPIIHNFELSCGQKALWYLNQLEPDSTAYHLGLCLKLTGPPDETALGSAWQGVGAAHPQLRARFVPQDGEPRMAIDPGFPPLSIQTGGPSDLEQAWKQIAGRPFSLDTECPIRALLLRDPSGPSHLLLCVHHIVIDLWACMTILRELSECYTARAAGRSPPPQREEMTYNEFVAAESSWLNGPQGAAAWEFWRDYLAGPMPEPILTRSFADGKAGEVPVILGDAEARLIRRAARDHGATPYAVLLACHARLLGTMTGADELVIGTPATIRNRAGLRNTVGYLVNSVPVRCPVKVSDEKLIASVADNACRALKHRRFPFPALVERLRLPRNSGATPLFQSTFAYYSLPREGRAFLPFALSAGGARWDFGGGILAEAVTVQTFDAQFPIGLTLGGRDGTLSGSLQYDGRRVTAADAARLAEEFPKLVGELLAAGKARPRKAGPRNGVRRLEDLFDEAADRTPNAIAVSEFGAELTYARVQERAEAIATGLNNALPGCGRPVALQMTSCAEASIMVLAILKSGRAFLPIDIDEPPARRNAALRQANACALVSHSGHDPGTLPDGVAALHPEKLKVSHASPPKVAEPLSTAYLIFTSGTTGEPKAVEVGHAAVLNHARAMTGIFRLTPQDRVLQFHTLAFDAAFEEIFPTWAAGACIVFEPQARKFSVPALFDSVASKNVTVLNLPTSHWHMLADEAVRMGLRPGANLRLLVVGGERASEKIYRSWRKLAPWCRWVNTYGATETTITALAYEPPSGAATRGALPIGRPIDGITTLILNGVGEIVSTGEGELLVGGAGLAWGYLGDAATTADKFVTRNIDGEPRRFFRTGDRVRLRSDGNFEYLGRLDRQLKIRGYRVDPEEIENALRTHDRIVDAAVFPDRFNGELHLAAWIVRRDGSPTELRLREYLSARLPAHMIPARLNFVRRLPRKPSGKLDTRALTCPRAEHAGHDASELAALFSELLGHEVGVRDDFFLCGGHSLMAIKLLGRVEARYGTRISVSDFLVAPTPQALWKRVQASPRSNYRADREMIPAEIPVSAQQSRALLAHEIGRPALANIVVLLRIDGKIDRFALERAVESIARRNPVLRCGFFRTDAGIMVRETQKNPTLECRTFHGPYSKNTVINLSRQEGKQPFAFDSSAPWLRFLLASTEDGRHEHLILITHHAAADAWTLELLLGDLRASYEESCGGSSGVPRATRDYRSHVLQKAEWLKSPAALAQASFWKQRLTGAEEPGLPFRRAASVRDSWRIESHEVSLSARLSRELRRAAGSCGTTPFAFSMACFKALVHRYAGQQDISLGTVVANRCSEIDQAVLGPMQNPALIRDEVTPDLSLRDLARRVGRSLVEAQDHGALPFEHVVKAAFPQRSAGTSEFGIQFLSDDRTARAFNLGNAFLRHIEMPSEESPFELSVSVSTGVSQIKLRFEHQPSIYPADGIRCLAKQYAALLESAVAAPNTAIGELAMTPADEIRVLKRRVSKAHRPRAELLQQGFEEQARRSPDAIAVIADGRRLTYGELGSMSESTASALAADGLKKGGLVAVMLPKGWQQVVASLAVLKAAGGYIPIDPALPDTRQKAIFERGGFQSAIVADATLAGASWARGLRSVLTIHSQAKRRTARRSTRTKPESLAYVIFTSGTTGVPKGVKISHRAAMTTIAEINRRFRLRANDRVLAVSAPGFDLSVFDIFGTLRAGGTIVMPTSPDPKTWLEQVAAERVTVWNSVPCLFELLLNEAAAPGTRLETLRLILLSGDFIPVALARRARTVLPRARLVSLGGATEAAIWSIAREMANIDPAWRSVPYGRPLRGQEVFVLDAALNHCPAGVTGELFIAGAALADGYWHDAAETKRRFVQHPRWKVRLYSTGDQGRYLENGEIEILGRLDKQVKVNGVRLELGDVEAALCSLPSVFHAVAEVRKDANGNSFLIAFVAVEPGTSVASLSAHAQKVLPAALRPSTYKVLDRFPLTANGKIDRAALRAMILPANTGCSAPSEDAVERWIAKLWSDLLGGAAVGAEDDFFALGGHSLLAIRMLQNVRLHFSVDLPLSALLERPTVRNLAAAVKAAVITPLKTMLLRRAIAELESDSEPVMSKPSCCLSREPSAVLLTGATGHLGSMLLVELLRRTNDRVYCLVRANSEREAAARVTNILQSREIQDVPAHRIAAIPADLTRERFGLEPSAFAALAADVRAVYHCAAEVNFIAPYEKLAASNVGGVREMIRLASLGGAVLHHVSSVAVFPYGGDRIWREDVDIAKVQALTGGYAQSKWVAERMVRKAIERGLRAVIYRPAQIVSRGTGEPPHDLFDHVVRVCGTLRAVPDIEMKIDMVTPEFVASAICALSVQESSIGRAFHLVHPDPLPLREFIGLLPAPPQIVPFEAWRALLVKEVKRVDDVSLQFVAMLTEGLALEDVTPPDFDCSGSTANLRGAGIVCPPLNRWFIQNTWQPFGLAEEGGVWGAKK